MFSFQGSCKDWPGQEGGQQPGLVRLAAVFNLIDKDFIAQIFVQQHGSHMLGGNGCLRCDACQGAEKVRVVDGFPGGAVEARGSGQEYRLSGTGGDNGLIGKVGFEGKASGAVSFYQDVIRQFRKAVDWNQGSGEFAMTGRGSQAKTTMTAQGGG